MGQNVNAYRGRNHLAETVDFADLLHLVNLVPGIERIRYTTSHPVEFTTRSWPATPRSPHWLTISTYPCKAAPDRILMAMKRGHTCWNIKRQSGRCARFAPISQFL
ncbi:MAG: hypothetical protein CM15mP74_34320 [Halieaceae bacterium]|nr:MAG: hypothetical protein CM15mP74_34320 [Halieaceae bacterium]